MELITRRLLLRPLSEEDAPAISQALNNYEVSKNLARVPFPYGLKDAQDFIALQRTFHPSSRIFAIAFKCAPDELIGIISYERDADGSYELGYWLRQCCWNMGLMSEAGAALLYHAFTASGLTHLHAGYHADNLNSARLLRKLGFVESHEELAFSVAQGKEVMSIQMKLTSQMWQAQQKSRAA